MDGVQVPKQQRLESSVLQRGWGAGFKTAPNRYGPSKTNPPREHSVIAPGTRLRTAPFGDIAKASGTRLTTAPSGDRPDMVTWLPHIFDAAEDPIANIRHSIINCVGTVERNPTRLVCKVYEPKLFLAIDDLAMGFVNIGSVNIGFVKLGFVNKGFVCIGFEKHGLLLSQYGWPVKRNVYHLYCTNCGQV